MMRGKKTKKKTKQNYNWEAVHLLNRIGRVFFRRSISIGQK
jgi:hypothetical protein